MSSSEEQPPPAQQEEQPAAPQQPQEQQQQSEEESSAPANPAATDEGQTPPPPQAAADEAAAGDGQQPADEEQQEMEAAAAGDGDGAGDATTATAASQEGEEETAVQPEEQHEEAAESSHQPKEEPQEQQQPPANEADTTTTTTDGNDGNGNGAAPPAEEETPPPAAPAAAADDRQGDDQQQQHQQEEEVQPTATEEAPQEEQEDEDPYPLLTYLHEISSPERHRSHHDGEGAGAAERPQAEEKDTNTTPRPAEEEQKEEKEKEKEVVVVDHFSHPILSNESAKDIILRFHKQRSDLQRAIEVCARQGDYIPEALLVPLHNILSDSAPPTSGGTVLDPNLSSQLMLDRSNVTADGRTHVGGGGSSRSPPPLGTASFIASNQRLPGKKTSLSLVKLQQQSQEEQAGSMDASTHVALAVTAIERDPSHPAHQLREQISSFSQSESSKLVSASVLSNYPTPPPARTFLERAYEAKRRGNRREEIKVLLEYLQLGQEGRVALDTAGTCRLLRSIGDAHVAMSEFVTAEQYYFDWYLIAERIAAKEESVRALTLLGDCCAKRGDLNAANEWYSQARGRMM